MRQFPTRYGVRFVDGPLDGTQQSIIDPGKFIPYVDPIGERYDPDAPISATGPAPRIGLYRHQPRSDWSYTYVWDGWNA